MKKKECKFQGLSEQGWEGNSSEVTVLPVKLHVRQDRKEYTA